MAKGSLVTHRQTQHGMAKGGLGLEGDEYNGGDEPITYRMTFPAKVIPSPCPVKGSGGWASTWKAMRLNICYLYVRYIVVILE